MHGARGSTEGWNYLADVKLEEEEEKEYVALNWAKFLTKYLKIRKLQLVFRSTGNYLNELVSKECRERLSKVYSLKN